MTSQSLQEASGAAFSAPWLRLAVHPATQQLPQDGGAKSFIQLGNMKLSPDDLAHNRLSIL